MKKPSARLADETMAPPEQPLATRLRAPVRRLGIALACLFLVVLVATRAQMVSASFLDGAAVWTAAQGRAITALTTYAVDGSPRAFAQYQASMATLTAFRRARDQMLARRSFNEVAATLDAGGIRILGPRCTVFAFSHFNQVPLLRTAVAAWQKSDAPLQDLSAQAASLHQAYAAGRPAPAVIAASIEAINGINRRIAGESSLFSLSIANAVVWVGRLLYAAVLLIALTVFVLWFMLSRGVLAGVHADHERLRHLATHEPLTGLANRQEFIRRCRAALCRAAENGTQAAVMFIDLDGFKDINDCHGHASGDELLCLVASRIAKVLRHGDVAARLGGDEFAVLQAGIDGDVAAACLAERLSSALAAPFSAPVSAPGFGASIGVAVSHGETDAEALLAQADQAMYEAKRNKPNAWRLFQAPVTPPAQPPLHRVIQPFAHKCQV